MIDELSRQEWKSNRMQHPTKRADSRCRQGPVDWWNRTKVRNDCREILIAEIVEAFAGHEDQRASSTCDAMPDCPIQVLHRVVGSKATAAPSQVARGNPRNQKLINEDLAAKILGVAVDTSGDSDSQMATPF